MCHGRAEPVIFYFSFENERSPLWNFGDHENQVLSTYIDPTQCDFNIWKSILEYLTCTLNL